MAKKKIDVKLVRKLQVMDIVATALQNEGFSVLDGELFGMTKGTIVIREKGKPDVQLKPIAPKSGLNQYVSIVEEEEEILEEEAEEEEPFDEEDNFEASFEIMEEIESE